MAADPLFVDTNVHIYATDLSSPWHHIARAALARANASADVLAASPQIIGEYLSALIRAHATTGQPPLADILANTENIRRSCILLDENDAVVAKLIELVQNIPTAGKQIHDANIVATMLAHGVRRLLTNNVDDFARFASVITIVPLA